MASRATPTTIVLGVAEPERAAERVAVRRQDPRQRLVHDRDADGAGPTSVRAIARPAQDRQPQDVEVALVDAGVVRLALARAERDGVDRAAEHQGQPAGVGDRAHARRRRQPLADRRVERRARAGVVAPGFRVEQRGGDAVAIEAGIDAGAAIDGPDEQARRDQQHQREGELPGDEDPAEPRAAPARAGALGLQPIGDVAACALQRRRQPEHQAGGERRGDGEREDAQVGGDLERDRHRRRQRQPLERGGRRGRHREPAERAEREQREHLGEELANQPEAAGAERGPHGEVAAARDVARRQQRGDVDAGDHEHERGGAEQHAEEGDGRHRRRPAARSGASPAAARTPRACRRPRSRAGARRRSPTARLRPRAPRSSGRSRANAPQPRALGEVGARPQLRLHHQRRPGVERHRRCRARGTPAAPRRSA